MVSRFWPIPVAILVLTALLIWSQMIPTPLKVSGFIEADEIRLGSRIGGRVAEVKVAEGDLVGGGQPLIVLEPYDLLEREEEARSQLQALEEDLARLKAGNRAEEIKQAEAKFQQLASRVVKLEAGARAEERKAAEAQLALAEARRDRADQTLARLRVVSQRPGAVTDEELDRAAEESRVAKALREVRYQELETLKNGSRAEDVAEARFMREEARLAWELAQKGPRAEDIRRAEAARDAAKSAMGAIAKQRQELVIRAPSKAAVESLDLQPGDLVGAGAPVMSLIDHHSLWIRAYVPQGNLNIHLEQQVAVTLDSFPDERFQGRIVFIARQGEFTPSNVQTPEERSKQVFRIKVRLMGDTSRLRPGMAADVWFDTASPPQPMKDAAELPSAIRSE